MNTENQILETLKTLKSSVNKTLSLLRLRTRLGDLKKTKTIVAYTTSVKGIMNRIFNETSFIEKWGIGGSVAGLMYGVNFDRVPHDIDVIVPRSVYQSLHKIVENSPFCKLTPETSSMSDEFLTQHFAFKVIDSPVAIDIIACADEEFDTVTIDSIPVVTLKNLLEAKKKYSRLKDQEDLIKLQVLYNDLYV